LYWQPLPEAGPFWKLKTAGYVPAVSFRIVRQLGLFAELYRLQHNRSALLEGLELLLKFQPTCFRRLLAFFYQPLDAFPDPALYLRA
jgi:hypothetical protein